MILSPISRQKKPLPHKVSQNYCEKHFGRMANRSVRASASNAHIEGDDTTASAATATSRLNNRTQIFKNAVIVPDTDEGLDKAGRAQEIAYQT